MNDAFRLAPTEWATLRRLLDEALDRPAPARAAWLDALAGHEATFAPRLRALLAHAADGGDTPATAARLLATLPKVETDQFAPRPPIDSTERAGASVGPYRLVRELGSGGMASVWLAERTDLLQRRQVALKLPHGAWKRAGLAERLAREREILATLEHPNIARLYDAGVGTSGQPWLALEYVEGERIDAFARRKALDIPARLALFLQVARAVAYAHAQLVVHRDLKPSNTLVTEAGDAKLLDFGIAKLLDQGVAHETELTREAGRALTPEYAAPEQLLGRPVGTAADVYALGVLLYELLAGCRPHRIDRASRAAIEEAVLHGDVARPSALAPPAQRAALRGDLDTIVLKALKKEPGERYATVDAFAQDVQRHLDHRPVLAQPDSWLYRGAKFVRRNRLAVGAAAAVLAALVAGTTLALWQAGQAREQRDQALAARDRADREATAARQAQRVAEAQATLADFLLSEAAEGLSNEAAAAQIERSLTMIRSQYRDDPALRGDLLADAANRLRWIGADMRARELFAEAEPLLRAAGDHEGIARILCMRARESARQGRVDEAVRQLAEGRAALARRGDPTSYAHSGCLIEEAAIARITGDLARNLTASEQAVELERRAGRTEREFMATLLGSLARARLDAGLFAKAVAVQRENLALRERIGQDRGPGHWLTWTVMAMALRDGGQSAAALRAFGGEGRFDPAADSVAPINRMQYALGLLAQGRAQEALRVLERARSAFAAQGNLSETRNVAVHIALTQLALGSPARARSTLDAVEPQFARLRADKRLAARRYLVARAQWAIDAQAWADAQATLAEMHVLLEAAVRPDDPPWRDLHRLQAMLALARAQPAEAERAASAAWAYSSRLAIDPQASLHVAEDLLLRGRARMAGAKREGARADAKAAVAHAEAAGGADHPVVAQARRLMAAVAPRP